MGESEIIQGLKSNGAEHERALAFLYADRQYKDPVMGFFHSKGLSDTDCETLWTDVVLKFSLLVKKGKFKDQGKLLGYLKNLSGYLLLNHFRDSKNKRTQEITPNLVKDEAVEAVTMHHKELKSVMESELSKLGEVCHKVLSLWSFDYSMSEIMDKMKFVSLEATRKRKHNCLKKLLENISGNNSLKSMLEDYYLKQ